MKYTSNGGDLYRKIEIIKDVESRVWRNSPSIWPSRLPLREPSRPAPQQQTKPYKTTVREGALSKMRNPTTRDDKSWGEKQHHEQREPSPDVGKKGKYIVRVKWVDRPWLRERHFRQGSCTHAMAGNCAGRTGGKLRKQVVLGNGASSKTHPRFRLSCFNNSSTVLWGSASLITSRPYIFCDCFCIPIEVPYIVENHNYTIKILE
jgi:hypothetical protein